MRTDYTFSNIRRSGAIPAKTRTTKESPLAVQMKKLTKVGHSFVIEGAELTKVAPTVYATARRLGVKINLRREDNGVGVYMAELAEEESTSKKKAA